MYGTASGDDPKKPVEGANTAYKPADYNLKGANVLYVGSTTDDSAFPVELNKVVPELWVASDEDCTAIAAFLKVQAKGVIAGEVYPDGPSEAKGQGYIYSYGVKPQVGERLSLVVTQTKLDGLITFKEDCYAYLGSIPVKIGANTNPPLTNPNDPDPAPVDHVNTQYGLKLTEDDIVPAAIPDVTAYLDVKLPKTTTDLLTTLYIGTQDVTYNRLEGSALFRNSDEGADRNTSMTLTAKKNSGKNPDAELELSKITLGTPTPIVRMKPLNKTSDQLVLDFINENFGGRLYLHYNDPD
ncbi:hypothetical protein SPFM20_00142 [Salmonella phage SPFM20]|nr:hypothetical protein SPFM20_00142 [Salmonella phage SPFM20]